MEEYNMYFFHQSFNFTYNFCFSTASFSLHYVLTLPMLFQQILQPEKKTTCNTTLSNFSRKKIKTDNVIKRANPKIMKFLPCLWFHSVTLIKS